MVRSLVFCALVSVVAGLGFVNQQLISGADFRSEVVTPDLVTGPVNILRSPGSSSTLERFNGRLYPIGLVEEYTPLPGWFGCDPQIDDINGFDVTDLRRGDNNGQPAFLGAPRTVTCVVTNVAARDMSVNTPLRTDNSMTNPLWWLGKRVLVQATAPLSCRAVRLNGLNTILACPLSSLRGVFNTVVGNGNRAYPGTAHLRSRFNGNQWEVHPVRNSFLDFGMSATDADVLARNQFRWTNPTVANQRTNVVVGPLTLSDENQAGFRINA
jgi:hypothetical protein